MALNGVATTVSGVRLTPTPISSWRLARAQITTSCSSGRRLGLPRKLERLLYVITVTSSSTELRNCFQVRTYLATGLEVLLRPSMVPEKKWGNQVKIGSICTSCRFISSLIAIIGSNKALIRSKFGYVARFRMGSYEKLVVTGSKHEVIAIFGSNM